MIFYIADAFAEEPFGGNPAGVVIAGEDGFPADEVCLKTAAELRYSETAFLKKEDDGRYRVRYFTPASEVDLCGHATIGAAACLMEEGLMDAEGHAVFSTAAGDIGIDAGDDGILMDMAPPELMMTLDDESGLGELYAALGTAYRPEAGYARPQIISTGLPDIIVPVSGREELMSLDPDMKRLEELSRRYGAAGVHVYALSDEEGVKARCRDFAPACGIDEEAATGTASGAAACHMLLNGMAGADEKCVFIQGESMGRPSRIIVDIYGGEGRFSVRVGGRAVVLASGHIYI